MSRFQILVVSILGFLVVVVGVGIALILKGKADAQAQADYERCMEIHGITRDYRGPLDNALDAAEACS